MHTNAYGHYDVQSRELILMLCKNCLLRFVERYKCTRHVYVYVYVKVYRVDIIKVINFSCAYQHFFCRL